MTITSRLNVCRTRVFGLLAACVIGLAPALTGCEGEGSNDAATTGGEMNGNAQAENGAGAKESSGDGEAAVIIEMTDGLKYVPNTATVSVGETVEWRNTGALMHTVTADSSLANDLSSVQLPEGAEPFNSGDIGAGQSYTRTFTVPGDYRYFCIPHEAAGMVGELTVTK
jgi:plastocyanin